MIVWGAGGLVVLTLVGLVLMIVLDARQRGWPNWLDTVREWQGTIGTVAGFISAAGVLALTSGLQENADRNHALRAAQAIGHGLAIEAERLVNPMQVGRYIINDIDLEADDVGRQCLLLARTLEEILIAETPVYDALLSNMMDFGDDNLALFVRFFGNYDDLRRYIGTMDEALCEAAGADQIRYLSSSIGNSLGYYEIISSRYAAITPPVSDEQIESNINADYSNS